jgi:hypothetical protein
MTISPLRLVALTEHIKRTIDFPDRASVRPLDPSAWLAYFMARSAEREPQLIAALALADSLEARFDPTAPDAQEETIRQLLDAARAAVEAESIRRQVADAQAEAERQERRQAFTRKHGLAPETARSMGWDPAALVGLLDDAPSDPGGRS